MKNNKSIVIILGAGSAVAWGAPLTAELTELIKNDTNFKTKKEEPLGKFVFERLCEFYKSDFGVNFETIINALENIYNYFMNRTAVGGGPNFIGNLSNWFKSNELVDEMMNFYFDENLFIEGRGSIYNKANKEVYPDYPPERKEAVYISKAIQYFLELIRKKISDYSYNSTQGAHKVLNTSLRDFLIHLTDLGYIIRIYTTNYDRLFPNIFAEDKLINFFDGFDNQVENNSYGPVYAQNLMRILNDDECQCYYNLHGSIFWDYNSTYYNQFVCSPSQSHKYTNNISSEFTNPGESVSVQNIITGYSKLQRISIEPLNSFRSVFTRDCINASYILSVGFSFSDFHINRPIINAFNNGNPSFLNITHSFDYISFDRIKRNILNPKSNFGINDEITDDWVKSVSSKQMIYKKGFENYLKNKEWLNSRFI